MLNYAIKRILLAVVILIVVMLGMFTMVFVIPGDPATAKRYLEDAVQQDPNSARAWLALGKLRESSGELTQALANYQRSYSLNNMQPMVVERMAFLNRQLSDNYNTTLATGGTRLAQPIPSTQVGNQRY